MYNQWRLRRIVVEPLTAPVMRSVNDSREEFYAATIPTRFNDAGDAGAPRGACERSGAPGHPEQKAGPCNCELDRRSETRSYVPDNQIGSRCVASICKCFAIQGARWHHRQEIRVPVVPIAS